ncbi:neuronal acetylcholine receptor subunit alpha-3-like [Mytilus galloprovincialis]|uniref:neuronal acetylcholine receptor subunit alpha-3-like n=1 Tax=Mytilus galloprovincialis TaxID=29158 RepID=UPI003F7C1485
MFSYLCSIIILLSFLLNANADEQKEDESKKEEYKPIQELIKNVTNGRNKEVRPVNNWDEPVIIYFYFHMTYIQEFDEVAGKLSLNGYFGVQWRDNTVSWDPSEYGASSFTFNEELFWKPTFIMSNPYGEQKILYKDDSVKRVHYTGQIDWFPSDAFDISCQADVTDYPFDTQTCTIAFVLSAYDEKEVILWPTAFITEWFVPHKTWDLIETNLTRIASPQVANFHIKLKRKPMFFVFNLILPIVLMCILNPFVFLLPADSGERVGFSITVLLAIAVFLTISASGLPAISDPQIPTLSILLFADVTFSGVIVILVIISLRYYLRDENIPVSYLGEKFVTICRLLKCGCCCRKGTKGKGDEYANKHENNDSVDISKIKLFGSEYQYRGTNSEEINSFTSKDEITWKNVGEELDFVFGTLSAVYMVTAHLLYILGIVLDFPLFS